MAETTVPDYERGLTFEKVWAGLMELRESQRESQKEAEKRMKETERIVKRTSRQMGLLNNRFGELAEHMVAPSIKKKFNELGISFDNSSKNSRIYDSGTDRIITEIDFLLENGDIAIAVEVKVKPDLNDVDEHVKRMEILRRRADAREDKRRFRGAIAGAIMSENVRDYILKNGFYVIEQTGGTMMINIPEGFLPRDF